jgi:NADH-quinone oxidoreductase subunit N
VAALLQENVKRMLAYSSIGHAGYILMGLVAAGGGRGSLRGGAPDAALGTFGVTAVLVYVLAYTFTNIGAFAVVAALRSEERSGERVSDFKGLSRRSPLLAFAMLVFLLSLAGMPATAGFIGKWYLFGAALSADYAWLAVIAVIMTTVSAYYYLRVVVAMYMSGVGEESPIALPPALAATLVVALIFTLLIGVYPARFLSLAAQGAADLQALGPFSWRL